MSGPALYGADRRAVAAATGSLAQVARVEHLVHADGPGRGSRLVRMVTGGGLEVEVHPDRALDLGRLTAHGVPLAWTSAAGFAAPGLYERDDAGTTFAGGLLATCGLDHVGAPVVDRGRRFPQHGRIGSVPANLARGAVVGDELVVEGTVRQTTLHEENLLLSRRIGARLGSTSVRVDDVVTNDGYRSEPHLVLYHVNIGWPLLGPGAQLEIDPSATTPDGPDAQAEAWDVIDGPRPDAPQRVYRHEVPAGDDGYAGVAVVNRELGLRLTVRYRTDTLPQLFQWNSFTAGRYVLGLEPANSRYIAGRVAARDGGDLPVLEPGESVRYSLELTVDRVPRTATDPTGGER